MPAKITNNEFLQKLDVAHSGTIIRLRTPLYTHSSAIHRVKCTECNHVWSASGYSLTSNKPNGCPECAIRRRLSILTTSVKDFCKQLNSISTTIKYVSGYTKVGAKATFRCVTCRHTWETMCISLTKTNPSGCPECAKKNVSIARIKTTEQFKQALFLQHGTSISVLGEYTKCKNLISVQCTKCDNVWDSTPDTMVGANPHGCPKCKAINFGIRFTKSKHEYEKQLFETHKGKIALISDYEKQTSNLQFECNKGHTWWTQYAYSLIAKNPSGCPQCSNVVSAGESELFQYVKRYAPDAQQSVRITNNPQTDRMIEWDIFIPSKNIAIEYNGVYHHSYPKKPKDYHASKSQLSMDQHGVRVIHVTDIEWKTNTLVVKKTLKHVIGITVERYYARKLTIVKKERLTTARRTFYIKNHLQGDPTNGVSFALVDKDSLIKALMSFSPVQSIRGTVHTEGSWELVRYASKGSVVGGASRLFAAFLREYDPAYILSYSQNDWFDGTLYPLLGFKKVKDCKHDYRTVWGNKLYHKSYTRRSNLQKLLGDNFDYAATEQQNLINNNVPILYDSGKIKWEWKR